MGDKDRRAKRPAQGNARAELPRMTLFASLRSGLVTHVLSFQPSALTQCGKHLLNGVRAGIFHPIQRLLVQIV